MIQVDPQLENEVNSEKQTIYTTTVSEYFIFKLC